MSSILEVTNIVKVFKTNLKKTQVLNWVNISINQWEVYGFLGPNGSWKTTTLKCIMWFLKPTSWEIKLFWKELTSELSLYKKIWYAPENAYFYDHLKWLEFIVFMGQLHWISKKQATEVWTSLLNKLWLEFAKDKFVKTYSKWMKQRLGLAASLINDPEIIFWDEPMSGLDPLGRILVKNLIVELKHAGKTVFFNTHILSDVQEVADKFWIIYQWKIVYEDYVKNLNQPLEKLFLDIVEQQEEKVHIR